jgi:hypothetical protein
MKKMFLEFSGWVKLNPETKMQYIGEDKKPPQYITIKEFAELPLVERQDYILENVIAAISDGEVSYEELSVCENI